jgi:hypothetical protein
MMIKTLKKFTRISPLSSSHVAEAIGAPVAAEVITV